MIIFTVVGESFSYNVILRRPALSLFQAVVSTYHQNMKFSVGDQVEEVTKSQLIARKCYVEMVQRPKQADEGHLGSSGTKNVKLPSPT